MKGKDSIRPSADKIAVIRDFPTPENEAKLDRFYYMLPFIRAVLPSRANLIAIIRSVV